MRLLLSAIVTAGSLILAIAAFVQSATTTPAATVPVNPASASLGERQAVCVSNCFTGNERPRAKRSDAALHGTGSP